MIFFGYDLVNKMKSCHSTTQTLNFKYNSLDEVSSGIELIVSSTDGKAVCVLTFENNPRISIVHVIWTMHYLQVCGLCCKTKIAEGCGHSCSYCNVRFCTRCGGRVPVVSSKVCCFYESKGYVNI